ncbi:NADPH:quinone reductase [Williamsia serinedens]|uniref:NADPH2:quinone reductase n=1 Tax=Williamsia serinedens TaxID=391736 RepID=A0ABT1GWQ1_9NOCA|nr:NADPH:quinone reductase [Williamsia serinedens]MCP2159411.1 NADPH2:quinone reductase [Williamsia serinedens]
MWLERTTIDADCKGDHMRAAFYESQGPAAEVLQLGDLDERTPSDGEVRVRLTHSGINPGDVKKRQAWLGAPMAFDRIVPHSDGAGFIEAVGPGVDPARVGRRVWVHGAQSYRDFGTAAQSTVVPDDRAIELPDAVSNAVGACLGIPGITAHRAVFADGPVDGAVVLVHGVLGAVGSLAAQLARRGGATVIGTVRRDTDIDRVGPGIADVVVSTAAGVEERVHEAAPAGVNRIIEVALSANVDLDSRIVADDAVIAAYGSPDARPTIPLWPLLFANVSIRLLGSDDFPAAAKNAAAQELSAAAADSPQLVGPIREFPLEEIAAAHELIENGRPGGRVVLTIDS